MDGKIVDIKNLEMKDIKQIKYLTFHIIFGNLYIYEYKLWIC